MSVQSPRRNPVPFGTYLLLDRINIGGMAEVWRGKSFGAEGFERMVAIKRILPNIAEEPDFKSMFIDEAKLSVLLSHANIAQVYELGELHGSLYIAMEYVAGKDLRFVFERARKQQAPLPIPLVCHVIQRAAEGLDHAHRKKDQAGRELNIVHRDVSPQNILLSYDGEVKVIDFGIAKAAGWGTTTQTGVLKGKFGYMSPEQVLGQKVDRRSDVFALGVCLYELLTGERLFQGESDFSVLEKVANVDMQRTRPSLQGLPVDLAEIVIRALAKAPEERYAHASDLADDLERYLHAAGRYFGRKDLMGFMQDAFGEDIDKELARQKDYAAVSATPEILEELDRGRTGLPRRPARSHTGEVPIPLPPPEASVAESQQTAAGSSRGLRAQAMRVSTGLETPAKASSAPAASGATHGQEASPERTAPSAVPQPPSPSANIGSGPSRSASALHPDTHVGPSPEPQVDLDLGGASTRVGPAPVRPPTGIAEGATRIGPAPQAPGAPPATREGPRRSQTVGMPIPGILTMETHVGAVPLPREAAAASPDDPSEDSTTGSGGDPRRAEQLSPATEEGEEASTGAGWQRAASAPDQGATLATPPPPTPEPADAVRGSPSNPMPELAGETLSMASVLKDDVPRSPPLRAAPGAPEATVPLPPSMEEGIGSLASPSRLSGDPDPGPLTTPLRSAGSEDSRAAASENAGRRRVRRGDAEKGAAQPAPTVPLPSGRKAGGRVESQEVTDARGAHRSMGGATAAAARTEDPSRDAEAALLDEDTDAGHRYAEVPEEETDAGRRSADAAEEDAGARRRARAGTPRGARLRPPVPAAGTFDEDEAVIEDVPEAVDADGLDEDGKDPRQADEEEPQLYKQRPRKAGRARALPAGAHFDGLFDARARRFTRRDLWLAGLAGAALAVVLTLLVSVVSGPPGSGLILVEVVGVSPAKTTVRLGGKELPRALQFPVRAAAPLGEVEVELSAEGYRPAKHLVRLTQPGEVAELRTSLEPL